MSFAFEVGRAYIGTPTVRDAAPQRVFEVQRRMIGCILILPKAG